MAVYTANFEAGVNNASVTTGAGEASATQWSSIFNTAPKYDNSIVAFGSLSCKFPNALASQLSISGIVLNEIYCRAYIFVPQYPTALSIMFSSMVSNVFKPQLKLTTTGTINSVDASGSITNGAKPVNLNAWSRVEWHWTASLTAAIQEVKIYNNMHSIFPDEISTSPSTRVIDLNWDEIRFGALVTSAWQAGFSVDNLIMNGTAYPGPYPKNTSVPLIHGTFTVGSTVSCDGGTWNDGIRSGYYQGTQYHTLTYQWTRDGANIVGQTGQTYTLASGDVGHYVQCRVTSTGVQDTRETASALSAGILV